LSFQFLPPLSTEQFAALRADIALRGVLVPIEVDETGAVLDGHHRLRAWHELRSEGVKVPRYTSIVRRLPDELSKIAHALRLNLSRRHIGPEERAAIVATLRGRGMSQRTIAELMAVSHTTVMRDLAGGTFVPPESIAGADGKNYPIGRASQPPSIVVHSAREEVRAAESLSALGDAAPGRTMPLSRAEARVRTAQLAPSAPPDGSSFSTSDWRIDCANISDLDVGDSSVDLVCTDPPYTDVTIPIFSELGAFCARVLKPGRLLACYVGKFRLPEEIDRLGVHLTYVWSGAVIQPGRHTPIRAYRIRGAFRPFVLFSNGPYRPRGWVQDTIVSTTVPDKSLHPWQQELEPFIKLVETCSEPDELVCDPFVGSGTTGVAALRTGRRFVGGDIDPAYVEIAARRLETQAPGGAS
jgi:site-specific DNA-methyltransferase (adenine-specific)